MLEVKLAGMVYFNVSLPMDLNRDLTSKEIEFVERIVRSGVTRVLNTEFDGNLKVTNIIIDNMQTVRELKPLEQSRYKP